MAGRCTVFSVRSQLVALLKGFQCLNGGLSEISGSTLHISESYESVLYPRDVSSAVSKSDAVRYGFPGHQQILGGRTEISVGNETVPLLEPLNCGDRILSVLAVGSSGHVTEVIEACLENLYLSAFFSEIYRICIYRIGEQCLSGIFSDSTVRSEIVPLLEELDCTRGSLIEHSGCLFQITKLYKS